MLTATVTTNVFFICKLLLVKASINLMWPNHLYTWLLPLSGHRSLEITPDIFILNHLFQVRSIHLKSASRWQHQTFFGQFLFPVNLWVQSEHMPCCIAHSCASTSPKCLWGITTFTSWCCISWQMVSLQVLSGLQVLQQSWWCFSPSSWCINNIFFQVRDNKKWSHFLCISVLEFSSHFVPAESAASH